MGDDTTGYDDLDDAGLAVRIRAAQRIAEKDEQEGKGPGWRRDDYDPMHHFDRIDHNTAMARRAFEAGAAHALLTELADAYNHIRMAYLKALAEAADGD